MKVARFKISSLLRLLPAALIGLIPMPRLDDFLLSGLYQIRGEIQAPKNLLVVETPAGLPEIPEYVGRLSSFNCLVFDLSSTQMSCLEIDLLERYSEASVQDLRHLFKENLAPQWAQNSDTYKPIFYGRFRNFESVSWEKFNDPQFKPVPAPDWIVFAPSAPQPPYIFKSTAGELSSYEYTLNMVGNFIVRDSLHNLSLVWQFILSLSLSIILIWIIYSFRINSTAILSLILALSYSILAQLSFQWFHTNLPLAAPLLSLLIVYILGISDRIDQKERQEQTLLLEAETLRNLDELKNNFISLVSHDLKTPLAQIQAIIERLLSGNFGTLKEDQQKALQKTLSVNGQLQRSISTLLLLNRVEDKNFELRREPLDLNTLLNEAIDQIQPHAREKGINFVSRLEPLFLVELDRALIKEVIINILENAVKFSPHHTPILVSSREESSYVCFEVQDRGPGIAAEDRPHLFQKFYKSGKEVLPRGQSVKGTGLGLYLSHFFVRKHEGIIEIFSRTETDPAPSTVPERDHFSQHPTGTLIRVKLPL